MKKKHPEPGIYQDTEKRSTKTTLKKQTQFKDDKDTQTVSYVSKVIRTFITDRNDKAQFLKKTIH